METFWCIFVGNSTFVSPPSEHEEVYIVYNCSLARTVLHEYSHIYFVLIWIACAGFFLQRKIKQIQDSVACMYLWTVVGLLKLHTSIFFLIDCSLTVLRQGVTCEASENVYPAGLCCVGPALPAPGLQPWLVCSSFLMLQYKFMLCLVPSCFCLSRVVVDSNSMLPPWFRFWAK